MTAFWSGLGIAILVFLGLVLLIVLTNLWAMRSLGRSPKPDRFPGVSILVPARNEEANLRACVESLLAQDYPDFEVIVLDDSSTDATPQILQELTARDPKLRVIPGQVLPADWLGKNWACHQLAQAATGELTLFTDADTRHHPATLRDAVADLLHQRADFISALPCEEAVTWAERFSVPFFTCFTLFGVLPMVVGHQTHFPPLAIANGQFMLLRRAAYDAVGGYAAIRGHAIDDMALVREIASHRLRWRFFEGGNRIRCRMYHSFREVREGFSKNLFAAFDYRVVPYVASWLWVQVIFWEPLAVLFLAAAGGPVARHQLTLAVAAIAASIILFTILYLRFRYPVYLSALYPVTMVFIVMIAWRSMALTLSGHTTWKGRTLTRHKPKLG